MRPPPPRPPAPGHGAWVAQKGRDHLNNLEQVAVQKNLLTTPGRWTVRITGFDIPDGPQTYAVAGMPDPDLPDLKVQPVTRVAIDSDGDGIADVNITELTKFHIVNEAKVTLTAVRPPARFGSLELDKNLVMKFGEKDNTNEGWINGGFFVLNKGIDKYLSGSDCIFEKEPLEKIANEGGLFAYKHNSFWQCVDTIRELEILEAAFDSNKIVL